MSDPVLDSGETAEIKTDRSLLPWGSHYNSGRQTVKINTRQMVISPRKIKHERKIGSPCV